MDKFINYLESNENVFSKINDQFNNILDAVSTNEKEEDISMEDSPEIFEKESNDSKEQEESSPKMKND